MNKDREIYGIDVSKKVFDVYSHSAGHLCYTNDEKGFKSLLKGEESLGKPSKVVYGSLKRNEKHLNSEITLIDNRSTIAGTCKARPTKAVDTIKEHPRGCG